MSAHIITPPAALPARRGVARRGARVAPLLVAAGAVLLASAGPPADAASDPVAAERAAEPGEIPELLAAAADRTAAYGATGGDVKLIWFTMTNCGPCQTIRPHVERMAAEGLPVFKVDLNSRPDLAQRFGVNSAPTFVLEVNGRETWRSAGVPGGDGLGVARRLRDRLTAALTAERAALARHERGRSETPRQPERTRQRLPERPRRPVEPSDVPLQLTGAREQESERRGLFDWFKSKPADDGPKTIDDPFPAAPVAERALAAGEPDAGYRRDAAPGANAPPVSPERDPMRTVVRINVFDAGGTNLGSGTVIASRPGRAVVLTCGHIFANHQPGGRIRVETFADGTARPWPATLIGFDPDSDVGLLAVDCPETLPASALAPAGINPGDRVVSAGCDGGDDPTRQGHVVQRVPATVGPLTFSCTGQPKLGRSGGGCFDAAGRLVGVVWSRSEQPPEGIYTAIEPIEKLLDEYGLTALKAPAAGPAPTSAAPAIASAGGFDAEGFDAEDRSDADDPAADELFDALFEESDPSGGPTRTASVDPAIRAATPASSAAVADVLGAAGGAEITCIIRPLGPAGGPTRIVVINRATQRTLALLGGDAAGGAVETSLYQPIARTALSRVVPARPTPIPTPIPTVALRLGNGVARTAGDAPGTFCRPCVCGPGPDRR